MQNNLSSGVRSEILGHFWFSTIYPPGCIVWKVTDVTNEPAGRNIATLIFTDLVEQT